MKILLIQDVEISSQVNLDILLDFAEESDIRKREGINEGRNFIIENLISEKKYIDLIIIQDSSEDCINSKLFVDWLKNLTDETYFHGYFKVKFLPIVLITNHYYLNDSWKFNRIIGTYHNASVWKEFIGLAVTNWRQQLATDLDILNLDLTVNYKNFNDTEAVRRVHRLKILTQKLIDDRKCLKFIWLGNKLKSIDVSANSFNMLIRKGEIRPNAVSEKEIHSYLRTYETLLKGEYKYEILYEKQFYQPNSRKYVEPDFINIPFTYTMDLPEIFEVKLPNHRLARIDGTKLLKSTTTYINQLIDKYYNYFSSPGNITEINKRAKISTNSFDYTILIGRKTDKEENLSKIQTSFENGVAFQIISYDELFEKFERLYERTKKYKVD